MQAGKLRWAAADAIGCDYARRYAAADLRRAGLKEEELQQLGANDSPAADRLALAFARKMTRAAYQVTDDEMADLLKHFGPEKLVGMVHTLAYANFQNRIFLALGVEVEDGGPLPPLEVRFDQEKRAKVAAPPRPAWDDVTKTTLSGSLDRPDWKERNVAVLKKALDQQKNRMSRVPLPDASRLEKIPPDAKAQAAKIVWTKVSMGYQPLLTKTWFDCMRTFHTEAQFNRVFSNSLFWVITRSNECFY
jgi:hypothetical protein